MRENIKSLIIALLLIVFAISYITDFKFQISGTKTTVTQQSNDGAEITQVYTQFSEAYDKLDVDQVTNLYESDAYYLSGEEAIIRGKDNIRKQFESYFNWAYDEGAQLKIEFDIQDRVISDSLAVDVAYYRITTKFPSEAERPQQHSAGKFITVLRKHKDGKWKFKVDGYNPAPVEAFES